MIQWFNNRESQILNKIDELQQELKAIKIIKDYLAEHYIPSEAEKLFTDYLTHIEAYCGWQKVIVNGIDSDPDEDLMRKIEESIGISQNAKKAFREEILIRKSSAERKGKVFSYTSYDRLREAIEKSIQ